MALLRWCNQNDHWFRLGLFLFSLIPGLLLLRDTLGDGLGFNPFEALIARTGFWAMFYLLLTLAITPLRRWLGFLCKRLRLKFGKRLADWNFLIKSRRMLGLFSFFYLSWHAGIYLHLELDWNMGWWWQDLRERPFLQMGLLAWILSLLLALTSPQWARRTLGKRWRQLHRAMYPLSILAVAHVLMEAKVGEQEGLVYATLCVTLLLHRLLVNTINRWQRADDDGLEAKR
ncbi:sulfite oxidase heme-binding subunit YedZ [Ketobacter sp.]|uniref:sulfite oxidase heme-binding subunit YedZ n=1 Tax=Ketobacter sp. TaxID=2083498 RepID=UPI000F1E2E55|nr:ferric reductase-like transmembrane domain-containing protein [Ketobacter sp.]RLT95034.1 MAG: sulfoxide reductase heme-binding subunit YedZ [Ketobacter sp.]